jgi:hypothetical protein
MLAPRDVPPQFDMTPARQMPVPPRPLAEPTTGELRMRREMPPPMPVAPPPMPVAPAPVPVASPELTTGELRMRQEMTDEAAAEPLTQRHGIRSHRNGDKPTKIQREDDHADTRELERLLGFFDEIRRARAWDEEPNGEGGGDPAPRDWAEEDSGGHHTMGGGRRSANRRAR